MANVLDWVVMLAETPEFISNYNRLNRSSLSFAVPQRSAIERLVDQACGHVPAPSNDPSELREFVEHAVYLWTTLPEFRRDQIALQT